MNINLPTIANSSAREIAAVCNGEEIETAITYLELVRLEELRPGHEIDRLLGKWYLDYAERNLVAPKENARYWEIVAVQNKLALALCIQRGSTYNLSEQISESVFHKRREVNAQAGIRSRSGEYRIQRAG